MTPAPGTARMFLFDIDGVFLAGKRTPRLGSGETSRDDIDRSPAQPDLILDEVDDLVPLFSK